MNESLGGIIKTCLLFLVLSIGSFAKDFKVMTFNTMCDFCHKSEEDIFSLRKNYLIQTINFHKADIISLQEVRTGKQLKELIDIEQYHLFYTDSLLMSYADPAIAIKKVRFEVLQKGQFWLGPDKGNFTLGWKTALPRQALWVKIKDRITSKVLMVVSSHFDNRIENLLGSAQMLNEFINKQEVPVLFAADTNSTTDFEGYKTMVGSDLINAFDETENFNLYGDKESDKDLCYLRKGKVFPSCRVDHILMTSKHPWNVKSWTIDIQKFGKSKRFASDHRAIISQIELR